jgi:hypothetical protein
MGIVWWCAGLLGVWMSRKRNGRPKRNVIPGVVIMLTGYAMSGHPQKLELSTMIHTFFGYTLIAAGLSRIIEIVFVLRDQNNVSDDPDEANSWQYLPPFVSLEGSTIWNDALICFSISFSSPLAYFSWELQKNKWRFSVVLM